MIEKPIAWMSGAKCNKDELLRDLVDFICLLYHEARNVRHPIKQGRLPDHPKYRKLIHLPRNRDEAWQHMAKVRREASMAGTARGIEYAFQQAYDLDINDLLALYQSDCWRATPYGGNRWAPICSKVQDLLEIIDLGDIARTIGYSNAIRLMEHNTGKVGEKLRRLKQAPAEETLVKREG